MEKVNLDTLVKDIYFGEPDVRIMNCLKRYDVKTLRQLVVISRTAILKMQNMGKKSRMVIEDWLEERGLHLGMTKEEIAEYEGVTAKAEEEQSAADALEEHPMIKTEEHRHQQKRKCWKRLWKRSSKPKTSIWNKRFSGWQRRFFSTI